MWSKWKMFGALEYLLKKMHAIADTHTMKASLSTLCYARHKKELFCLRAIMVHKTFVTLSMTLIGT